MSKWFVSDLHLGDAWTTKMRYCGEDIAKHDAWLAERWDANVASGDDVWILGDMVRGMPVYKVRDWLAARPGRKHLVLGNHDDLVSRNHQFWTGTVGLTSCWHSGEIHLRLASGDVAVLSHYPPKEGETYRPWLHGHTHRRQKITAPGVVHVGWEAWRRYVPEADVIEALEHSQEKETV